VIDLGIEVSVIALLTFTLSDTIMKRISANMGCMRTTLFMTSCSALPVLAALAFVGVGTLSPWVAAVSLIAGIVYGVAFLLTYLSLETEQVSNTMSLLAIEYALITLFGVFALQESVSLAAIVGSIGIFAGSFLIATKTKFKFNKKYLPVIVSNVLFAVGYALFVYDFQISNSIATPLFLIRVVASVFIIGCMVFINSRERRPKAAKRLMKGQSFRDTGLAVSAGVVEGIGALAFASLPYFKTVAIGSVIIAMEPALILVLGYMIYKDRFTRVQMAGFALVLICLVFVSMAP
jgi:drug/metabolite transporter (DMT)-like permease